MVHTTLHTYIASYSVEVIFLGMNCVLYLFCAYTLWGQKSMSCRLLYIINTGQFLLCATQVTIHTTFLFLLLTVVTNVPLFFHHVSSYMVGSSVIYNVNFGITGFLSIWRLYVLYDNNLRICIPAFLIWLAQICASGITIHNCATTSIVDNQSNVAYLLLWVFIAAAHLCVALPILFRLCIAQKKTHSILSSSPYKSVAIILVECGALITLCSVAMLILLVRNYGYALVGLGVATEAAVTSQLLITARHAMLSQIHETSTVSASLPQLAVNMQTESGQDHVPMGPVEIKSSRSLSPEPKMEEKKSLQQLGNV